MLNKACTLPRRTPEVAVHGATCHAAAALGLGLGLGHSRAQLAAGFAADFVAWDLDHPRALACWSCRNPCRRALRAGIDTDLRDLR